MIYITGDTHSTNDFAKLLAFPGREKLTKDDYVIIAVDFGGVWYGGKIHRIKEHVLHLMRGQIYEIEGKTFFTFGGGISIDKAYRTPGRSWWPEEEPSYAECEEALANLEAHGNKVDYVITHACPRFIMRNQLCQIHKMMEANCAAENFLDEVQNRITYDTWYFGHYHLDAYLKEFNMYALYQDVVKCV